MFSLPASRAESRLPPEAMRAPILHSTRYTGIDSFTALSPSFPNTSEIKTLSISALIVPPSIENMIGKRLIRYCLRKKLSS